MTAPRKDTYFPLLWGAAQAEADEWLRVYLTTVRRIYDASNTVEIVASCPQTGLDGAAGTGNVRTAEQPSPSR